MADREDATSRIENVPKFLIKGVKVNFFLKINKWIVKNSRISYLSAPPVSGRINPLEIETNLKEALSILLRHQRQRRMNSLGNRH